MPDIVAEIQKNLPGTDRDRYEVAYRRGRAQARSALLVGGLGVGAAVGAAVMWLLDPERGARRRAEASQRIGALARDAGRTAAGKATDLRNRAQGFAIENDLPGARPEEPEERISVSTAIAQANGDDAEVDDPYLVERVRAELRGVLSEPERVQVAALRDGVILRGEMQASEALEAIARARSVSGVERVDDRTRHLGEETAPQPEELPVVR
jgi:gas vesicle protein